MRQRNLCDDDLSTVVVQFSPRAYKTVLIRIT